MSRKSSNFKEFQESLPISNHLACTLTEYQRFIHELNVGDIHLISSYLEAFQKEKVVFT